MSKKTCRVHHWVTPSVGDDALVCEVCGRELAFMGEVTPNIRASIMVGYERRCGPGATEEFRSAFNAAYEDARRCFRERPPTRISADLLQRPDWAAR